MKIGKAFNFVNEQLSKSIIKYDIEPEQVSVLMQQENVEIKSGPLKRASEVEVFNEFDKAFYAGENSNTIVYYSSSQKKLALMSNEFAVLLFVYKNEVNSVSEIKPIVESALTPNKQWEAFEIVE